MIVYLTMVPLARQRPCLPLWGRCPSAHAGADEVGTHRRFIPTPNKQNCRCPALLFPSILLKVHTSLGAFQPHPTRLAPGHLPQRGRLWYAKRSFTARKPSAAEWLLFAEDTKKPGPASVRGPASLCLRERVSISPGYPDGSRFLRPRNSQY